VKKKTTKENLPRHQTGKLSEGEKKKRNRRYLFWMNTEGGRDNSRRMDRDTLISGERVGHAQQGEGAEK